MRVTSPMSPIPPIARMPAMTRKPLAAVLLLALLIRGGVLLLTPGALAADPDGYRRLAENLVARHVGTSPLPLGRGPG